MSPYQRSANVADIRFESNLKGGKQSSDKGRENLEYGVSITDGQLRYRRRVKADMQPVWIGT